jgi:hypothetical protein
VEEAVVRFWDAGFERFSALKMLRLFNEWPGGRPTGGKPRTFSDVVEISP